MQGCGASTVRKIVYLHGIGGPNDMDQALSLLNDHLAAHGYAVVEGEDVIAVDYDAILSGLGQDSPDVATTWIEPDEGLRRDQRQAYVERAARIRARLVRTEDSPGSAWGVLPEEIADVASYAPFLAQVDRYAGSAAVRRAVWARVIARIPRSGEIVLVGHSLGSVIAVDLVPRLPRGVVVRSLVTLASPLGFVPRLRRSSELLAKRDGFPFDRVHSWTNLYWPGDVVAGGRGISGVFHWASDAAVSTGSHGFNEHLNHPATLEILEEALHATYVPARRTNADETGLPQAWIPQLLAFAWSQRLGDALAGRDERLRRRLRGARIELARRSVDEYRAQLEDLDQEAQAASSAALMQVNDALDELRDYPTEAELVDRPAELLSGRIRDRELLEMLVPAVRAWPVAPFQTADRPTTETRTRAVEMLLARVRKTGEGRVAPGDADLAAMVLKHIQRAQTDMGEEHNNALGWWLLAGVGVLAVVAAPLTFGASIPAGLSGAAAMTAGLAAFGPGGMAGGIAMIGLLAGGGALAAGTGVGIALAEEDDFERRTRDRRLQRQSQEFRRLSLELPPAGLREMLTSLLAVVRLHRELGLPSDIDHYVAAQRVLGVIQSEHLLHQEFAPGADASKDWGARVKIMSRFAELLRPERLKELPAAPPR